MVSRATRQRTGTPYRRYRLVVRAAHAAAGLHCWLCGKAIDYRRQHGDRWAWELDHAIPVWADPTGDGILDPANARPSHATCNRSRGAAEGNRLRRRRTAAELPTW